MDISNSNVEPFFCFLRFTEQFNRSIKITYGALQGLGRNSRSSNLQNGLIELPTGGEPWGDGDHTRWREIATFATHAGGFLSHMALVYLMSAFEDLLIGVKAECDRYSYDVLGESSRPAEHDDEDPGGSYSVWGLLDQLRWSPQPIEFLAPVLRYFITLRNCILSKRRVPVAAWRSPMAIINRALTERYLVYDVDDNETIAILRGLNKWQDSLKAYKKLYPKFARTAGLV